MKTKTKQFAVILIIATIIILGVTRLFEEAEKITQINKAKAVGFFDMSYQTQTVNITKKEASKIGSVTDKIRYYSKIFGVDPNTALRIGKCESNLNPNAENINGSATGIYQFIRKTWHDYCEGDVYNEDANIICFMRMYPQHPGWWECE